MTAVWCSIGKMMLEMDNAAGVIENLITSRGIMVDRVKIIVNEEKKEENDSNIF